MVLKTKNILKNGYKSQILQQSKLIYNRYDNSNKILARIIKKNSKAELILLI